MRDELLNILSDSNEEIDNQKLMDYISDKLSAEEKHEFEKEMAGSPLLSDTVEGLEKIKNKKQLDAVLAQLNGNLKKQLNKKRILHKRRKIKDIPLLYLSIILILIIILVGFLVIKKHLEYQRTAPAVPSGKEISIKKS